MLTKLELVATTDYLTDLPNRRRILQSITDEAARIKSTQGDSVLVLADIDNFKRINDTYGHNGGDVVLKEVSRIIKANLRAQDSASRWGGEEFLLLLPDTDYSEGLIVADKIRQAIGTATMRYLEKEFSVTVTLGVTAFDPNLDIDANIKMADEAMYAGKKSSHG